jgi:hypothetical protein
MKKFSVQCYSADVACFCGREKKTRLYRSISDFYEGPDLFICPHCKALFALDKESFKYLNKDLKEILRDKVCPGCQNKLCDLLNYPKNYQCSSCMELQVLNQADIINSGNETVKFYDLLS